MPNLNQNPTGALKGTDFSNALLHHYELGILLGEGAFGSVHE